MSDPIPDRMSAAEFRRRFIEKRPSEKTPLLSMGDKDSPFRLNADQTEDADDSLWRAAGAGMETDFFMHTKTPGNSRRHWQHEARDAKRQRSAVRNRIALALRNLPPLPIRCTVIRYSMGTIDRYNLGGVFKHVIDGIADAYEFNDRNNDVYEMIFEQVKAPRGVHKFTLRIEPMT